MTRDRVVQAWRDPRYRRRLGASDQSRLPPHPSGIVEIDEELLRAVTGGSVTSSPNSLDCCSVDLRGHERCEQCGC